MASNIPRDRTHFVCQHQAELIRKITMVHPVLDYLLQRGLLTQEHYDTVKAKETTQEKMRCLYQFSRGWSNPDKDMFYQALKANNPGVIEKLEGTSLSAELNKMTHNTLTDIKKEYKESMKRKFQRDREYNSCRGKTVNLQERYTNLFMRKGSQKIEEIDQEIMFTGKRHLPIMEKRSVDKYSPTTIQALFDPDEDGNIPHIVVLEGAAGIGKTMTSKKIMLEWASEKLWKDKFDFVFFLSCREITAITRNKSLVGLLSSTCRLQFSDDFVSILKDPRNERKHLFIVDGFDELRWTVEEEFEGCLDISMETHKEIILQKLLRKEVLQQSSLIITTRSLAMKKLNKFIDDSSIDYRYVEIQGFTRKDRKEYVHKFFGNKEDANKVLSIIKDSEIIYTMCAIPITCWIVCTVLKQEIKNDLDLIQFKTMTSIYLLYLEVLLNHHSKKDQPVDRKLQALHTCLKKLCALANEGILNQQILFEKEDLERHGLSLSDVESVFLNENIFHWDIRTQTCYSFIHLSVQEFLCALYYVLDDGSGNEEGASEVREDPSLPEICKVTSLLDLSFDHSHLALAVQFLFGLLNEREVKVFTKSTGINISLRAGSVIKEWGMKDIDGNFTTHAICCLYETQDEDFIRRTLSSCSNLMVYGYSTEYMHMDSNYSKQLSYCLKTLKSESFQSLYFQTVTVDSECQKCVSPLLHRCQEVSFVSCTFHGRHGEDNMGEDRAEDEEMSISSEDTMKPANLSFLIDPESNIQDLCLRGCDLSPLHCHDLRSLILTNSSLTKLDLSRNNLQESGINVLFAGIRELGSTPQDLSVCKHEETSACDELYSDISTKQTLTRLKIRLGGYNEARLDPMQDCCLEVIQETTSTSDGIWHAIIYRRTLENGLCEPVSFSYYEGSGGKCSIL